MIYCGKVLILFNDNDINDIVNILFWVNKNKYEKVLTDMNLSMFWLDL